MSWRERTRPRLGIIERWPSAAEAALSGVRWLHEDGFRILARQVAPGVRLVIRHGNDVTRQFAFIMMEVGKLGREGLISKRSDSPLAIRRMLVGPKHPLTISCQRISLRMIETAAEAAPSMMRSKFDGGAQWMRAAKHPKRCTVLHMIISLMAADFWEHVNNKTDTPDWQVSANSFRSTNSDVIVGEALIFFWYNFLSLIREDVKQNKLSSSDREALPTVGLMILDTIQSNFQASIADVFRSRIKEYEGRDASENPSEIFSRVLLRSMGKQVIDDPDHAISTLSDDQTTVKLQTAAFMKEMIPGYFEKYKHLVEHYSMD
jgi:hypothetical protein